MSEPVARCDEHLQIKLIGIKVALYDRPQCHRDKLRGLGEMEKMEGKKRFFCCFVLCSFVFLFVFACLFWFEFFFLIFTSGGIAGRRKGYGGTEAEQIWGP